MRVINSNRSAGRGYVNGPLIFARHYVLRRHKIRRLCRLYKSMGNKEVGDSVNMRVTCETEDMEPGTEREEVMF